MIRFLVVVSLIILSTAAWSQEKVTLNGYVRDSSNGEELIGVTVFIPELKAGTVTNAYGFYAITVPKGTYEAHFSFVGFKTKVVTIELAKDVSNNIELEGEFTLIEELVVTDKAIDENVVSVQMSKNTLDLTQIKKLPALFGEVDIIKNIQMLPGVISAGEGTSAFFVRGEVPIKT